MPTAHVDTAGAVHPRLLGGGASGHQAGEAAAEVAEKALSTCKLLPLE